MIASRTLSHLTLIVCATAVVTGGCSREPTTPEAKRQRGDEIVRAMSDRLAQATTFTVETTDTRERSRGGRKITLRTTRQFTLRRPDRLAVQVTGDTNDLNGWYDGQKLTFVSNSQKIWVRVDAEPNIDATLDRLAERLAMPMPVADFMYSSPYDALIGTASTGGYVGRETLEGVATLHVAYQHPSVDWDLWVNEQGDPLPKKYRVTDKTLTPPRTVEVVFNKWQLGAAVADAAFAPVVPPAYERIPLVVQADEPAPAAAPATP